MKRWCLVFDGESFARWGCSLHSVGKDAPVFFPAGLTSHSDRWKHRSKPCLVTACHQTQTQDREKEWKEKLISLYIKSICRIAPSTMKIELNFKKVQIESVLTSSRLDMKMKFEFIKKISLTRFYHPLLHSLSIGEHPAAIQCGNKTQIRLYFLILAALLTLLTFTSARR